LFAEQAVQSLEWDQKIAVAVADMDNELGSGDGPEAYTRVAIHECISTHLDGLRASIDHGDRSQSRNLIDTLWLPNRTWDSLAREGATASDVSEHMPHGRMLEYRLAYEMVPDMQRLAEKELSDLGHLRALPATGGPIETNEKLAEIEAVEALKLDNDTFARESRFLLFRLRRMDLRLDRTFVERNVRAARAHYGTCITSPHLAPTAGGRGLNSVTLD
jgi:hypothetical protein